MKGIPGGEGRISTDKTCNRNREGAIGLLGEFLSCSQKEEQNKSRWVCVQAVWGAPKLWKRTWSLSLLKSLRC